MILTREESGSLTWRDLSALNNTRWYLIKESVYISRGFYLQCNVLSLTGLTAAISSCSSCEVSAPTAYLLTVQMTLELMTPNKNKKGFTSYLQQLDSPHFLRGDLKNISNISIINSDQDLINVSTWKLFNFVARLNFANTAPRYSSVDSSASHPKPFTYMVAGGEMGHIGSSGLQPALKSL